MKDEVEEFLRRVAQMRAQAEAQAKGQPQRPASSPRRPTVQPPSPPPRLVPEAVVYAQPVEAEVIDAELAQTGERVGRRVAEDLRGSAEIAEHARRLGEEVDAADSKMAAHLHQVFDHQIGDLKGSAAATVTQEPSAGGEPALGDLLRMLRSPQSVRDAVLMAEILHRPDERWQ